MKPQFLITLFFLLTITKLFSQDLLIYHGRNGETTIYDHDEKAVIKYTIKKKKGETFSIKILNPNPLFYKYEIKYEEQEAESENENITNVFTVFNNVLRDRSSAGLAPDAAYDNYRNAINNLVTDINTAKRIIDGSDNPELPEDALRLRRNGGLRYAIDQISNPGTLTSPRLLSNPNRFHSPTLSADLNILLAAVPSTSLDDLAKEGLTLLNTSLINKVNELKNKIKENAITAIITNEFVVTDKKTKAYLIITRIDASNTSLIRDHHTGNQKIELATIIPLYDRVTLELVPTGTFLFSKDVQEFYIENSIVKNRLSPTVKFSPGMILNLNVAKFGDSKEMAAGIGAGYKLSTDSKFFQSFYFSTLFSYRNYFRIGIGFGFSQFPSGLKDGAQVNQPLPANIQDINDIIKYEDKFTGFLTISFTGLNLSKK